MTGFQSRRLGTNAETNEGCHQPATPRHDFGKVDSAGSIYPVRSQEPDRSIQNTYHEAETGLEKAFPRPERAPALPLTSLPPSLAPKGAGEEWTAPGGNGRAGAIEGMALRGFGLDPEGDGELSGVSKCKRDRDTAAHCVPSGWRLAWKRSADQEGDGWA